MAKCVILNALPLSAFDKYDAIIANRVSMEHVRETLSKCEEVKSYVRHPATVELINKMFGINIEPNAGLYTYNNEVVIVVVLKKPIRGQEVNDVNPDDIEFWIVEPYIHP